MRSSILQLQARLFPEVPGLALANPIASDLSVMRVSLWPGLLKAALRESAAAAGSHPAVRAWRALLATGAQGLAATREIDTLAGIACGHASAGAVGPAARDARAGGFLRCQGGSRGAAGRHGCPGGIHLRAGVRFRVCTPGRAARLLRKGAPVGWLGELHPSLVKALEFTYPPVLFELDVEAALAVELPAYREISRFPQVRRDLAVVLDESVALSSLTERVTFTASSLLRDLRVFDVYRGPGVETGRKSVALGLIFQDISRTLTDDDVDRHHGGRRRGFARELERKNTRIKRWP